MHPPLIGDIRAGARTRSHIATRTVYACIYLLQTEASHVCYSRAGTYRLPFVSSPAEHRTHRVLDGFRKLEVSTQVLERVACSSTTSLFARRLRNYALDDVTTVV